MATKNAAPKRAPAKRAPAKRAPAKRAPTDSDALRLATELEIVAALQRYQSLTRRIVVGIELQADFFTLLHARSVRIVDEEL